MPNEMTAAEAEEILDGLKEAHDDLSTWNASMHTRDMRAIFRAENIIRAIAAGEYKRVVHAHWEQKDCSKWPICSNCGKPTLSRGYCPAHSNYCPSCGALMGKDDSQ